MSDEVEQPEMNERGIGDNMPPLEYNPMEYDALVISVNALLDDAHAMFTGVPVENEDQYETVKALQDQLKSERLTTERQRKIDKQPYIDAGAMVQNNFAALLDKLVRAETAAKDCVKGYLQIKEQERLETARKAQAEREAAEKALQEAHAEKSGADMEESDHIATLEADAKAAKKSAGRANKKTATGLKTVYTPEITDKAEVVRYYWTLARFEDALLDIIKSDIHSGFRDIPGVKITEERVPT